MKLPRQPFDLLGKPNRVSGDLDAGNQRERLSQGGQSLQFRKGGPLNIDHAILEVVEGESVQWSVERGPLDGFIHSAVTFTPDAGSVISGGWNGTLTAYDTNGEVAGHYVGHTSLVKSIAVSPDGGLLVSGAADQTVRLWNVQTFELLLTIFYDNQDRWVAWTPSGHYIASSDERADSFFGWHINRGPYRDADFVTARQLRKALYRPDIVNEVVRLRSVEKALQKAGDTGFKITELNHAMPPSFIVKAPSDQAQIGENSVTFILNFEANPEPLLKIDAYVNGIKVPGRSFDSGQQSDRLQNVRVPLQSGENKIKITASNRIGESVEHTLTVNRFGAPPPGEDGTLYLVAVGVNQFEHHDPGLVDLEFASADARAVDAALGAQAGKAYSNVKSILLTDGVELPTKANIENALSILSNVGPRDTVVLFLAGHGVNQGSDYYFLPRDTRLVNGTIDPSTAIGWEFLQQALASTVGRRILLVDTCHSGNAFNQRLDKDSRDENILLISATDHESLSIEDSEWGHGAFTYAFLQGLEGNADLYPDRLINIKELDSYISSKVREMTRLYQQPQQPTSAFSGIFKDFVFAKL